MYYSVKVKVLSSNFLEQNSATVPTVKRARRMKGVRVLYVKKMFFCAKVDGHVFLITVELEAQVAS